MGYTSTEVKRRYNDSVYRKETFLIPKGEKEQFKEKCYACNTSMRQVMISIIERFLNGEIEL